MKTTLLNRDSNKRESNKRGSNDCAISANGKNSTSKSSPKPGTTREVSEEEQKAAVDASACLGGTQMPPPASRSDKTTQSAPGSPAIPTTSTAPKSEFVPGGGPGVGDERGAVSVFTGDDGGASAGMGGMSRVEGSRSANRFAAEAATAAAGVVGGEPKAMV